MVGLNSAKFTVRLPSTLALSTNVTAKVFVAVSAEPQTSVLVAATKFVGDAMLFVTATCTVSAPWLPPERKTEITAVPAFSATL